MDTISTLANDFAACSRILTAIGDETRQHLIFEMMKMGSCSGESVRHHEKTHLYRHAVSHNLQIMKDAGIVKVRKVGTKKSLLF